MENDNSGFICNKDFVDEIPAYQNWLDLMEQEDERYREVIMSFIYKKDLQLFYN